MILFLIGIFFILAGVILFVTGFIKLCHVILINNFYSEKKIDRLYEKEVIMKSKEYKDFAKNIPKSL